MIASPENLRGQKVNLLSTVHFFVSPPDSFPRSVVSASLPTSNQDPETKARLEAIEFNAKAKVAESAAPVRDAQWYKRNAAVPTAPIFTATTEDVGTDRARANHVDAALHYCTEQIALKVAKAPL